MKQVSFNFGKSNPAHRMRGSETIECPAIESANGTANQAVDILLSGLKRRSGSYGGGICSWYTSDEVCVSVRANVCRKRVPVV